MDHITPDSFISTVFPPDLLLSGEKVCIAHPNSFVSRETGERVDFYRQLNWKPGAQRVLNEAWYYCVSTVVAQRRRQIKKRLEDVRTAFVLVVDDVGTKSQAPTVEPSYVLETSDGNFQWGYLLEPFDVSTPDGAAYYDQCLMSLAAAGFNDPGFRSANRLARLPGSLHKSGFTAVVRVWEPWHVWELEGLMREFDVPLVPVARRGGIRERAPGTVTLIGDIQDPLYFWLVEHHQPTGYAADFAFIECPWRSGHTDGRQGPTATVFSPYGYGRYRERGFKCLHGHCAGYSIRHFEEWARSQGANIDLPGVV